MDQITQNSKIVNLHPAKDISGSAFAVAYVNMENYGHVDFVVAVGVKGGSALAVTLKEAVNKSGSSSAVLTGGTGYQYNNITALSSGSIQNDTLGKTTLTSGTFNIAASTNSQMYVIPVEGTELNRSSSMTHLGIGVAAGAALVSVLAILSEPRYASTTAPTALD